MIEELTKFIVRRRGDNGRWWTLGIIQAHDLEEAWDKANKLYRNPTLVQEFSEWLHHSQKEV